MKTLKLIILALLIIITVLGIWHGFNFEIGNPHGFYFSISSLPFKRFF